MLGLAAKNVLRKALCTGITAAAVLSWSRASAALPDHYYPMPMQYNHVEDELMRVKLGDRWAYRYCLKYFGVPTRVVVGTGGQGGGFNVEGFAGGGGSALANVTTGGPSDVGPEFGLITWVYDNFGGIHGVSFMVTYDEADGGAVRTLRLAGLAVAAMKWKTVKGGISLRRSFFDVLRTYGYPDMTIEMGFDHRAMYFFRSNVAFGFFGNQASMMIDSITIGPGGQPPYSPILQGGGTTSGLPPPPGITPP